MNNLAIAIERGLEILKPHERKTPDGYTVITIPAVVGPFKRQYLELLVDAAMKNEAALNRVKELETALESLGYMTPPEESTSRQRVAAMAATLQANKQPTNEADQAWAQSKATELGFVADAETLSEISRDMVI